MIVDLGKCCACDRIEATVVVFIEKRAPVANTGWGCKECHLPNHGCIAVLCATCANDPHMRLQYVVFGVPAGKGRIEARSVTEPWEHDRDKHPEMRRH